MTALLIPLAETVALVIILYLAWVVWDRSARSRWEAWVAVRATRRLRNVVVRLRPREGPGVPRPPEVQGVPVPPGVTTVAWTRVVRAVYLWCAATPAALAVHLVKLCWLVVVLLNVGTLAVGLRYMTVHPSSSELPDPPFCLRADRISGSSGPSTDADECLDAVNLLVRVWQNGPHWVREAVGPVVADPSADPLETAKTLSVVVLLVMLASVVRAAWPLLHHARGVDAPAAVGWRSSAARWQPVVVLLAVCGSVGLAYERVSPYDLHTPRVSLKAAERAVWTAWRVRHGRVHWERRGELKKHAAQVVGALRAMEARQDREAVTGKVFEETAAMLLKIAARYAQGRTLALLDPEDLEGVTPAVSREWVRLVAFGTVVIGTVTGALAAGMPPEAATPLIGAVSLVAWGALYGGRLAGTELVDVMRGQSRS
ncbi:hypothetical protein [Streptomyces sp. CB02460]|uniref:hypothetical protein n=1 Tax=Streptomyces sp. CB02460 TaxID=1703941 RepID=UPI000D1B4458|nr:hypothetical protein [Streptomyces sp. CB02460]